MYEFYPKCVSVGRYRLFLESEISRDNEKILLKGSFAHDGYVFETSEIALNRSSGAFSFSIRAEKGVDAFKALGAEIRYIAPSEKPGRSADFFANTFLHCTDGAEFSAALDPNALWDVSKTFVKLPNSRFVSELTDRVGEPYVLEPLPDAALVFARSARAVCTEDGKKRTARHDFYLSFSGGFSVIGGREILLGLYGMEYFAKCDRIAFQAGCSAFLGADFSDEYENGASTSWLSLTGDYYSAPESMPLYAPKDGVLQPFETPAACFSVFTEPVPFFPWRNARISDDLNADAADDTLYRRRRAVLDGAVEDSQLCRSDEDETVAVTPSGLCAGVSGIVWNWLGIAQTSDEPLPNIRIRGVTPSGKKRLLQKDCFIALTSADEYREFGCGDISLELDGWKAELTEENWNGAILIIKLCRGFSVKDKLSGGAVFERLWNRAHVKGAAKENYRGFIETVTDERFEGVLLLNVRAYADESRLSPEVVAAVRMTGAEYLDGVYAAIRRGEVDMTSGSLRVLPSQIDALIAYSSEGLSDCVGDYACKTVGLETVIQSSRVVSFTSRTELLPKSLLGERLTNPQRVTLIGRAEVQNGTAVYRFSTERGVSLFPESKPVEEIAINDACMSAENERSRFTLKGSLRFTNAAECDIFSYDELVFDGAAIVFGKDAALENWDNLRLLTSRSEPREGSLAETFGVFPREFIVSSAASSPDVLGYSSITAPARQSEMSADWSGLVFRVQLGGSGALGADSPLFFDLICAWKNGGYYFGVRTDGAFSRRFSVQNLLSVGFRSISLVKPENKPPCFKLNSLTLKILGLPMPPKSADLYLFGDGGKVGWFFGYAEGGAL